MNAAELSILISAKDEASGVLNSIGGATTALAGVIGGALGAGVGILGQSFGDLNTSMAQMGAEAGLDAGQIKALTDANIELYKNTLLSEESISGVMGTLITLGGVLPGATWMIGALTTAIGDWSLVTGQDAVAAETQFLNITKAFNIPAEEQIGIMDLLTTSHERYGTNVQIGMDFLLSAAPALQAFNMGAADGVAILNMFTASGLDASSSTAAFNKAVGSLTDTSDEGRLKVLGLAESIGLSGYALMDFMKLSPGEQFQVLIDGIGGIEDPAQRAAVSIDLFGTKAGPKLANALDVAGLDSFRESLEEVAGSTDKAADAIGNTLPNRLRALRHQIVGTAQDWTSEYGTLIQTMGVLGPMVTGPLGAFVGVALKAGVATKAWAVAQWLLNVAMSANPIILIVVAIAALTAGAIYFFTQTEIGRKIVTVAWETIQQVVGKVKDFVVDAFNTLTSGVKTFVSEHETAFKALAVILLAPFLPLIAAIVLTIKHFDDIKAAVGEVISFVKPLFADVVDFVKAHWELLLAIFAPGVLIVIEAVKHFEEIKDIVVGVFNAVNTFVTEKLGFLGVIVSFAWEVIKTLFVANLQAIWATVQFVFEEIKIVVSTVLGVLAGIFDFGLAILTGDWAGAWTALKGIVDTFKTGVEDTVKNLLGFLATLGTLILGVIGDLASLLYDTGKAIIQGLWNGMKDVWEKAKDWVGGIAGDIAGGVKDALKVWSPSQVMFEIGQNVTKGLHLGMLEGMKPISLMAPQFAGAIAGGSALAGGRGNTTNTSNVGRQGSNFYGPVTVQVTSGGSDILAEIERQLR